MNPFVLAPRVTTVHTVFNLGTLEHFLRNPGKAAMYRVARRPLSQAAQLLDRDVLRVSRILQLIEMLQHVICQLPVIVILQRTLATERHPDFLLIDDAIQRTRGAVSVHGVY